MSRSKSLVVHADDLGLCESFNDGILQAATDGILTSTCLRANGTAFIAAVREVIPACPGLGIGVHLNVVEGRSMRRNIPKGSELYDAHGMYRFGFVGLAYASRRQVLLREIEADFRDQIDTISRVCRPDHLNGHMHCHAIPAVFEIACRLAKEYGIPFIRVPDEPLTIARGDYPWAGVAENILKVMALRPFGRRQRAIAARHGVATNGAFVGLLYTGFMDEHSVWAGLRRARVDRGPVEVLLHPCANPGRCREEYWRGIRNYVMSKYRCRELHVLKDRAFAARLRADGWELTNYAQLAGWQPRRACDASAAPEARKLRVLAILDETPFYQPEYLRRLISESREGDIVAVARVVARRGGIVQRYMVRNWRRLGVREFLLLAAKSMALRLKGRLPRIIRGAHEGTVRGVIDAFRIPTRTIATVRSEEFHDWVRSYKPDIILSSNSLVFPESLLRIPRLGAINRHSALLPSYGGILPVFRAFQKGEPSVGVSVHVMTKGIDEGPVLARRWIPVEQGDTLDKLYQCAFTVSVDATEEAFRILREHGADPPTLAPDALSPSYYSFPTAGDWQEFRRRGGRFI